VDDGTGTDDGLVSRALERRALVRGHVEQVTLLEKSG
jgi:hypothetical protein